MTKASPTGTKGVPRAAREQQILDVATDVFARAGFASASMVGIATAAGISKPLLYAYFGSKDGLYLATLTRIGDQLLAAVTAAMSEQPDLAGQPLAILDALFRTLEPQRQVWSVVFDPSAPHTGEAAHTVRRYRQRLHELALSSIRELLHAAGDDDPADASALADIWIASATALIDWWVARPEESAAAMTARAGRLITVLLGRS
jgi:AcrR family transcriptional regulator